MSGGDGPGHSPNLFAAPAASLETPGAGPLPWFRPALVPAAVSMAIAAFGGLVGPVFLMIMIRTWRNVFEFGPIPRGHPERRYAPTPANLTALLMFLLMAGFGVLAARAWVEHRWRAALGCSAAWLAAVALLWVFPPFSA